MLPRLRFVRNGLWVTTETIASQLARPSEDSPTWNELEWRLAMAVAAAHGVSPLLSTFPQWQNDTWNQFLLDQREHVRQRHARIEALWERIDAEARRLGVAIVPLKGSVLHGPGLYVPGDRPMADIDLLVHERDAPQVGELLRALGYTESFATWKHQVFKPVEGAPPLVLGEHRDTPINIELHTRIQERLPVTLVDLPAQIYPREPVPGFNPYPSIGALMSHLLLHVAGNICTRSLRLIQLNDIALLAMHMLPQDWQTLWRDRNGDSPWWALPPLRLVSRYYKHAIPADVLARLAADCPPLLRMVSLHRNLTQLSCSALWQHAFAGIEWSRSISEAQHYLTNRAWPSQEAVQERRDMIRTQAWLQDQPWVTSSRSRRMLAMLAGRAPRMDTLYVVNAALKYPALAR